MYKEETQVTWANMIVNSEVYNGSDSRIKRVSALIEEIINLEKRKRSVSKRSYHKSLSLVTSENLRVETCLIISK